MGFRGTDLVQSQEIATAASKAFNISVWLALKAGLKAETVELVLDEVVAASSDSACSLDHYLQLPDHSMDSRIAAAREKLGSSAILLGHHYQRDEVIRFADFTGDSYKLSKA